MIIIYCLLQAQTVTGYFFKQIQMESVKTSALFWRAHFYEQIFRQSSVKIPPTKNTSSNYLINNLRDLSVTYMVL